MGTVPVGSLISVSITDGLREYIAPSSIHWSGGLDYVNYLGLSPDSPPPSTCQFQAGSPNDQFTYSFLVDGTPKSYTVTLSVAYLGTKGGPFIAAPNTTLTLTTVAPTVTDIVPVEGAPVPLSDGTNVGIQLLNGPPPYTSGVTSQGMVITATTSTSTFGGSFMFLQMITPQRFMVDAGGVRWYEPAQGAGPAIDNGWDGATGYPIINPQQTPGSPPNDAHSRGLAPNASFTATMTDSPGVTTLASNTSLSAGNFSPPTTTPPTPQTPESFDTYVMYHPPCNGDWVGLAKIHWAWSGQISAASGVAQIPNVPAPMSTNPLSGGDQFPGWTDTATAILGRGWQAYPGP